MSRYLPFLLIASLFLASCLPANRVPIESVHFAPATAPRANLAVLLPGRGSGVRSFSDEGPVRELLEQRRDVYVVGIGESLPARQVVTVQCGHDWQTCRLLWRKLLADQRVLSEGEGEMTKG